MKQPKTLSTQPPKPPKGASPAEIKAWVVACRGRMTPSEVSEYEATGHELQAICDRIEFDPRKKEPIDRLFEIAV